jgi:hypothetical protein
LNVFGYLGGQDGDLRTDPRMGAYIDLASIIDGRVLSNVDTIHGLDVVTVGASERRFDPNPIT